MIPFKGRSFLSSNWASVKTLHSHRAGRETEGLRRPAGPMSSARGARPLSSRGGLATWFSQAPRSRQKSPETVSRILKLHEMTKNHWVYAWFCMSCHFAPFIYQHGLATLSPQLRYYLAPQHPSIHSAYISKQTSTSPKHHKHLHKIQQKTTHHPNTTNVYTKQSGNKTTTQHRSRTAKQNLNWWVRGSSCKPRG